MDSYIVRKESFGFLVYNVQKDQIMLRKNLEEMDLSKARVIDTDSSSNEIITAPTTVFWEVTDKCNSRCRHCFNNIKHNEKIDLTYEQMKGIVDELNNNGVFRVKVTGGEPFCRQDLFCILDYLETKNINFIIYSNGKLINEHAAKHLKKYNHLLCVRISIDGNQETNDSIRGDGAFNAAFAALKILSNNNVRCQLNYTITRLSYMQLSEISELLISEKINCKINVGLIKISGASIDNNDLCFLEEREFIQALDSIKEQIKSCDNIESYELLPPIYYQLFGKKFGCPAARLTATINSSGQVYPCGLFSGISEFICGDVLSDGLKKAWRGEKMTVFRNMEPCEKCNDCEIYTTKCTGACRGNAYHYYNSLCAQDINCSVYKINFSNLFEEV